jgi:hypothetical protein
MLYMASLPELDSLSTIPTAAPPPVVLKSDGKNAALRLVLLPIRRFRALIFNVAAGELI